MALRALLAALLAGTVAGVRDESKDQSRADAVRLAVNASSGGGVNAMCCCIHVKFVREGCPAGHTWVASSNQCCRLFQAPEAKDTCSTSLAGQMFATLKAGGKEAYYQSSKRHKCVEGEHADVGVVRKTLESPAMVTEIKVALADGKWKLLPMSWTTLTEREDSMFGGKPTWVRARKIRVKVAGYGMVNEGESLKLKLILMRHNKVEVEREADISDTAKTKIEYAFQESDLRKVYLVYVEITRSKDGQSRRSVTFHGGVFYRPTEVCGVSFMQRTTRDCSLLAEKKPLSLAKKLGKYAMGIEYELVGAPDDGGDDGHASVAGAAMLEGGDDGGAGAAGAAMLEGAAGTNQSVETAGGECKGLCAEVKHCIWSKLGWEEREEGGWMMVVDGSVKVMGPKQTSDANQFRGVPFELVSPGPPEVMVGQDGLQESMDVLAAISHMGAQAPLTAGLHAHVNVWKDDVSGQGRVNALTLKQVVSVWVSWARFQLIIDEMITPDRLGNSFAEGLRIGWGVDKPRADTIAAIFKRSFEDVWKTGKDYSSSGINGTETMSKSQACNTLIKPHGLGPNFCDGKIDFRPVHSLWLQLNPEKYFAINLTPLGSFGTIEFRSGSATLEPERAARWIQFLVGFVDAFKDTQHVEAFFEPERWEDGFKLLKHAQRSATPEELMEALAGKVDDGLFEYFHTVRPYERAEDTDCVPLRV